MEGREQQLQEPGPSLTRAESCPERLAGMMEDMVMHSRKFSQNANSPSENQLHGSSSQVAASSPSRTGKATASTPVPGGLEHSQSSSLGDVASSREAQGCYLPKASVFIANLPREPSDDELAEALRAVFSKFGRCWILVRRDVRKKNIPYAFVQYRSPAEAEEAMYQGSSEMILGRPCRVEVSRAHRAVFLTRKDDRHPTAEEISRLFQGYEIEETWTPTRGEREKHGLGNGVWVRFLFFGGCQEALKAFRGHRTYHLLYKDYNHRGRPHGRMDTCWPKQDRVISGCSQSAGSGPFSSYAAGSSSNAAGPSSPYTSGPSSFTAAPMTGPSSATVRDLTTGMLYTINPLPAVIPTTPGHFSHSIHSSPFTTPIAGPIPDYYTPYQVYPHVGPHHHGHAAPGAALPYMRGEAPAWNVSFNRARNQVSPSKYAPQELDFDSFRASLAFAPPPPPLGAQPHLSQQALFPSTNPIPSAHSNNTGPSIAMLPPPPVFGGIVPMHAVTTQVGPPGPPPPPAPAAVNHGSITSAPQVDAAYDPGMESSSSSPAMSEAQGGVPMTPASSHF